MDIQATEDGILDRIRDALGERKNKIRTIDSLPGDWDIDMMKRMVTQMPGVFVVFAGGTPPERPGGAVALLNTNWVVLFTTAHASGQAARRRGDALQPGAYELLQLLVPKLHRHIVPGEGTLSLVRIENLYTGALDKQGVAVYAATFQMAASMPEEVDAATLDVFETLDVQWDVPPHDSGAQHQKWLKGDLSQSAPDAHDTIKPEQE